MATFLFLMARDLGAGGVLMGLLLTWVEAPAPRSPPPGMATSHDSSMQTTPLPLMHPAPALMALGIPLPPLRCRADTTAEVAVFWFQTLLMQALSAQGLMHISLAALVGGGLLHPTASYVSVSLPYCWAHLLHEGRPITES